VLPGGSLNQRLALVAQRVPVQLLRIGPLYLIGIPGEVTITAGLRLRRAVAQRLEADLHDVLVAGYSNGYIHYVTTPEEYEAQQYEGASTLFGRWELPAFQQTAAALATAMHSHTPVNPGAPTDDLSGRHRKRRDLGAPDQAVGGSAFGDVVVAPRPSYLSGQRVVVVFVGAHPNNDLHRGGTYLRVERSESDDWLTVHDDGDWVTRFAWGRLSKGRSEVTVTWEIPLDARSGHYRITYYGDARDHVGVIRSFVGTSPEFEIVATAPDAGR
jgi:neutral ceramidase